MDKILRPERFDADPNVQSASVIWKHWFRTFNTFITKAETTERDKLDILINYVAPTVYEYIAECKTFDSAISTLERIYVKPKNEVFARHLLSTCKQETGQSLDQFLQKLKSLAKDCAFRSVTAEQNQNDAIRDSFISGMQSNSIRQRLLENRSLDLDTAYEQARSLEMAFQQATSFSPADPSYSAALADREPVKTVQTETSEPPVSGATTERCYFCGYPRHPRFKCPAKDAICQCCKKRGHFHKMCRSAPRGKGTPTVNSLLSSITLAAAPLCLSKSIVQILANGVPLQALIDTGSSDSYISSSVVERQQWKVVPSRSSIAMASTRLVTHTHGHCHVTLNYKNLNYPHFKLSILPNLCADVLLGHDFLCLHTQLVIPFGGTNSTLSLCNLAAAHIDPPPLFANLSSNCTPIATKSRRHSASDELFIQQEVEKLLKEGIIEPCNSPWRAQVLVTTNERHKRRMVIDYSQTVNRFTLLDAYPIPRIEPMIEKISSYVVFSTLDLKSAYHQIPIKETDKMFTAFEACGNLFQFRRIPFGVTNGVSCFQRVIDQIIKSESLSATFAYLDNITICGENEEQHNENLARFYSAAEKYGLTFNEDKSVIAVKQVRLLGYEISHRSIKPDPERLQPLRDLPVPKDAKSQQRVVGLFAYYSQWISHFSDKIQPLIKNRTFPLPDAVACLYRSLKEELSKSVMATVDPGLPLTVETDASETAIGAVLTQQSRPVAFFSRTLTPSERNHSSVEKEAYAIVEAVRKWRHYLLGTHFRLVTDQRSVAFMYDMQHKGKVKNDKIQRWRIELSCYSFDVVYRRGEDNTVADTLSRGYSASLTQNVSLKDLHDSLCHPGVVRMLHFVRSRNLPFSLDDVRRTISSCAVCAELKPKFCNIPTGNLIKATRPFERLNIDFKGPLPSSSRNKYLLTIIDEYSRFPFAFACPDMTASTVIDRLCQLFSVFGMPSYIHSDRGSSFMSEELKHFLHDKGIVTSRTTAYNPQANGQVERLNGTLWRCISLAAKSRSLPITEWETVLLDALHSIRSLLCTATNTTPHERLFTYNRKSTSGTSLPSWLAVPGRVFMRRNVRLSKYEPCVEEVELIECNPKYAHVRLPNGREETVSIHQLAPKEQVLDHPDNTPITNSDDSHNNQSHSDHTLDNTEHSHFPVIALEPSVDTSVQTPKTLLEQQQRVHSYNLRNREV